jgi:DNA repair exonuclease SbcCD nuclease subunit
VEPSCIITDTHLGIFKSADIWHEVVLELFKEIADTCVRRDIKRIIHLGDFYDNRRALNVKTLNYAHQIGQILNDFETWIVVGNHDQYFKNQTHPHSLVTLREFENIHIVDEPQCIDDTIGLVPWSQDFSKLECPILMGHFEINGFKMNDGYIMRRAHLNKSDFDKFRLVVSGHFHTPTPGIDGIKYLGSPYQQDFGDAGSSRGYHIYNGGDFEFIEYTKAPKFIIINTDCFGDLTNVEGNIIKIVYDRDHGTTKNTEMLEEIQLRNPLQVYTDFGNAAVDLTEDIIDEEVEMKSEKEVVRSYLKKSEIPDGLELKTVVSMFNSFIDSVLEDMKK